MLLPLDLLQLHFEPWVLVMELIVKLPLSLEVSEPMVVVAPPPSEADGMGLGLERCGEWVPLVGAWPL